MITKYYFRLLIYRLDIVLNEYFNPFSPFSVHMQFYCFFLTQY